MALELPIFLEHIYSHYNYGLFLLWKNNWNLKGKGKHFTAALTKKKNL